MLGLPQEIQTHTNLPPITGLTGGEEFARVLYPSPNFQPAKNPLSPVPVWNAPTGHE